MTIKKQSDGQGLNPGHPDSEVEVLTALPHMPPQSFKMRLNAKSFLTENEFYEHENKKIVFISMTLH